MLNIYSPVSITASGQRYPHGAVWAPVDRISSSTYYQTWISLSSPNPWWRIEFPAKRSISSVVIHPKLLSYADRVRMSGFSVYVGDSPVGNGSSNAMCGKPWAAVESSVIIVNCSINLFGRYLYVAGSDVSYATLYLSEISVYVCQGRCTKCFSSN